VAEPFTTRGDIPEDLPPRDDALLSTESWMDARNQLISRSNRTPGKNFLRYDHHTRSGKENFGAGLTRASDITIRCRVYLWRRPGALCVRRILSTTVDARLVALDAETGAL